MAMFNLLFLKLLSFLFLCVCVIGVLVYVRVQVYGYHGMCVGKKMK